MNTKFNFNLRSIIYTLGFLLVITACNDDDNTDKDEIDNEDPNAPELTLDFPSDWSVVYDYNEYITSLGSSPLENSSDIYRESISIAREKATGYDLEMYYEASLVSLNTIDGYEFVSSADTTINGYDSKRIVFLASPYSENLKLLDYIFVEEGYAFVITCASLSSNYDNYLDQFETIVRTMEIE